MNEPTEQYRVLFQPDNVAIMVNPGDNLMESAIAAGVHINASCGGSGTCGTCNVVIHEGEVESTRSEKVSEADYAAGVRQSCRSRVKGDLVVEIPAQSRLEMAVLSKEKSVASGHHGLMARGWRFDPPVTKLFLELTPPTTSDNSSDLTRLVRVLEEQHGLINVDVSYAVIRKMAHLIRQSDWRVTATVLREDSVNLVINLEAGDTRDTHYGLVFDIGTTAVRGQLLDLNRGRARATTIAYNGQLSYGADVISRMVQSQKPGGQGKLQRALVSTLNELIHEMVNQSQVDIQDVNHLLVAANTVMVHLLLGINPLYLRVSPYVPTVSLPPPVRARDLEIEVAEHVHLCVVPSVASYVGGDIVAGILGSGIYQRDEITLYIDIGTNGEIVVGNREWMVTAAASAGPTFEGGGVKHGMLATQGAIEDFALNRETLEPITSTIGNVKPLGICGSGLINAVAVMLRADILGQNGKFNRDLPTKRIRSGQDGYEYVLATSKESQSGKDIVITEIDVDNLIRAKAAIFAGCQTLIRSVGAVCGQLERVIIAGSFGSHLDVENAITIGLLPDLPRERFIFIGNGSLLGARLSSFSRQLQADGRRIAAMMTNLELSERPDYMENYMAAMFLPHTNAAELFPSVRMGEKHELLHRHCR
jgi:uncharacterized 2Fe-2S/4Fe-4S cluster protein (DUF4445 family)